MSDNGDLRKLSHISFKKKGTVLDRTEVAMESLPCLVIAADKRVRTAAKRRFPCDFCPSGKMSCDPRQRSSKTNSFTRIVGGASTTPYLLQKAAYM